MLRLSYFPFLGVVKFREAYKHVHKKKNRVLLMESFMSVIETDRRISWIPWNCILCPAFGEVLQMLIETLF